MDGAMCAGMVRLWTAGTRIACFAVNSPGWQGHRKSDKCKNYFFHSLQFYVTCREVTKFI